MGQNEQGRDQLGLRYEGSEGRERRAENASQSENTGLDFLLDFFICLCPFLTPRPQPRPQVEVSLSASC